MRGAGGLVNRRHSRMLSFFAAMAILLGLMPTGMEAKQVPPTEFPRTSDGHAKVIVTYRDKPNLDDIAGIQRAGGKVKRVFSLIPGVAALLSDRQIAVLRVNPRVL